MDVIRKCFSATFLVAVFSIPMLASAAVVSVDWHTAGDNLITRDDATGLDWLDLTETNNMTFNSVSGQLGTGGLFEGFRYATSQEVVTLWDNFGIDISVGAQTAAGHDANVIIATQWLGNIMCELNCDSHPYGATGVTANIANVVAPGSYHERLGAYHNTNAMSTSYFTPGLAAFGDGFKNIGIGSYLVSTVPVPATAWLFGSGLLGLIGVARHKKA